MKNVLSVAIGILIGAGLVDLSGYGVNITPTWIILGFSVWFSATSAIYWVAESIKVYPVKGAKM